jgi:Phytanoyl-CoA dioxygenase (PhyH)
MAKPFTWLFAPFHVLALFGPAKSFRDNPVLGSARLNRAGLHLLRKRLALRCSTRRRASLAGLLSPDEKLAFERDGFLVLPNFLPDGEFAALRAEILGLATAAREFVDGYTLTRLIPLDAANLAQLPATRKALLGDRYQGLHAFVGSRRQRPYLFVQSVFSGIRAAPVDVQSHFHVDTFHATVKSWLFLDEVAPGEAGFTYVPGSHRPTRRHLAWERRVSITAAQQADRLTGEGSLRIEPHQLARLGYRPPSKLAVAPNTLVIADTSGFHRRGIAEGAACRVSIWAYARANPFLPWATPALRLPGAIRAFWAVQDLLARMTGRGNGWRWAGIRTPTMAPVVD